MRASTVFKNLDLKRCDEMYRPDHKGIMIFTNALRDDFHERLKEEVITHKDDLKRASPSEGGVKQNFHAVYLMRNVLHWRQDSIGMSGFPTCEELSKAYSKQVYNFVSGIATFNSTTEPLNSFGIHRYPANTGRIEYHVDYSTDTNLIGMISVAGLARFSVAKSRDGKNEKSYIVNPGDMVLMRANRDPHTVHLMDLTKDSIEKEHDLRPFHKIEALSEDRYSIIIRHDVKN